MAKPKGRGRRPALQLTHARAARLYRLVVVLSESPRTRQELLTALGIGLRTFYREVALLARVGIRVRLVQRHYELRTGRLEAEERLPFPDPQLTFSEMKQLVDCPLPVAQRLSEIYREVLAASGAFDLPGSRAKKRARPRR